jgi:cation transport ATPase
MCRQTIEVAGLSDARTAYEVEQYLMGVDSVDGVTADFLNDTVVVEYDENEVQYSEILDRIEHAGCVPSERVGGLVDKIRLKLTG